MNARIIVVTAMALGLLAVGCSRKPKEIPSAVLNEAAQNASEAEFALQVREYARAESLLAHAVELNPGEAAYWVQLGGARKKLGNTSGARKAYERARDLFDQAYRKNKDNPALAFAELHTLVLLGKPDDARKLLNELQKARPDDIQVKAFVEQRMLDQLLASPAVKELAL